MTREEGVSGLALAKGEVVTVSFENHPSPRLKNMLEVEGFQTVAGVPLVAEGHAIGTFVLGRRRVGQFTPDEITLPAGVGRQLAVLIDRAQLYEAARREIAEREQVQAHLEDANKERMRLPIGVARPACAVARHRRLLPHSPGGLRRKT